MKTVKLYTLCSQIVDCPHQTPVWLNEGVFVVRNYNLINGRIDKKNASYVDEETYKKRIKRATPESGDIIISREAPMGVVGIVPEGMKCCLGQRLVLLKVNKNECDASYLLYMLQSYYVQSQIKQIDKTGSIVSNLNIPDLKNLDIPYVDISIQKKISKILSTLDDKIDVNNKINEELEAMAKVIYNYWFVQNADKRWEKKTIKNISERVQSGGTPSKKEKSYFKGNINWFTTGELDDTFTLSSIEKISEEAIEQSSAKMFPKGSVLVAIYASPTAGKLGILSEDGTFNQAITGIIPKNEFSTEFIFLTLLIERSKLLSLANGTAQKNLSTQIVKDFKITIPSASILQKFNKIVSPIFSTIIKNRQENACLAQLRDFLLPLLMNGQVTVKAIESKVDIIPFKNQENNEQRFKMWLQKEKHAARGETDLQTLREMFNAMDDDDK